MTDANNSSGPPADPQGHPPNQPPAVPPTPAQGEVGPYSNSEASNQQATAIELAREFRWVEVTSLIINGALAIVGIIALCIYYGQFQVMRGQLGEIIKQYPEIQKSSNAAKNAADTARDTLQASQNQFREEQRPYIWLTPGVAISGQSAMTDASLPDLKKLGKPLIVQIGATNGGHSPALTIIVPQPFMIFDTTEKAKQAAKTYVAKYAQSRPFDLSPNSGFLLVSTRPLEITDEVLADLQFDRKRIYVLARIQYRDIFAPRAKDPYETAICMQINPAGNP